MAEQEKIKFSGMVRSVQPRSNVWRYRLDNRSHSMNGYNVFIKGVAEDEERNFAVAISEKQQEKWRFHIGDEISGTDMVGMVNEDTVSPWTGEVPALSVYDWRGCRMLDGKTYRGKCFTCKWACMANVTIEYDWGVSQKYRFESFCYGPKNCKLYRMGRPRAVPYKGDAPSYDEGCLDEICTERRTDDE